MSARAVSAKAASAGISAAPTLGRFGIQNEASRLRRLAGSVEQCLSSVYFFTVRSNVTTFMPPALFAPTRNFTSVYSVVGT
jgi:hypothetical protein